MWVLPAYSSLLHFPSPLVGDSGPQTSGWEEGGVCLLAVWLWINHLTSLSLSYLPCRMGRKTPTSKKVFKDYMTCKMGNCLAHSRSAVSVCRKKHDTYDEGTGIRVGSRPEEVEDFRIDSKEPKGSIDRVQHGRGPWSCIEKDYILVFTTPKSNLAFPSIMHVSNKSQ